MKSFNLSLLVHGWWFFILPIGAPSDLNKPLIENSSSTQPQRVYSDQQIQCSVSCQRYKRNEYDANLVEKLLYIDSHAETLVFKNWWNLGRRTDPSCSIPPNDRTSTAKISIHKFFQERKINIPLGPGTKEKSQSIELPHLAGKKPRTRHILKCDCVELVDKITVGGDEKIANTSENRETASKENKETINPINERFETNGKGHQDTEKSNDPIVKVDEINIQDNKTEQEGQSFRPKICVDGKIYLSRGVGGDKSVFVHIPALTPETFVTVAHLYFNL